MDILGNIYKIKLPITETYFEFLSKYGNRNKKIEAVYKITFEDGKFYIGNTHNLISRIYAHVSMQDLIDKNGSKPTKKHDRIKLAMDNNETIQFEIISNNMRDERDCIRVVINEDGCLNMKI